MTDGGPRREDDPNLWVLRGELREPPAGAMQSQVKRPRAWTFIAVLGWLLFGIAAGIAVLPYMRSEPQQTAAEPHEDPAGTPPAASSVLPEPPQAPAEPALFTFPYERLADAPQPVQAWSLQRPATANRGGTRSLQQRHDHIRAGSPTRSAPDTPQTPETALEPPKTSPLGCPPAFRAEGVC
jgi:hypothetical protein